MHALVQPQIQPLTELPELPPLVEKPQLFDQAEQLNKAKAATEAVELKEATESEPANLSVSNGRSEQTEPTEHLDDTVHEVAYQSWTKDNLWVLSEHEQTQYYTTRWDALCPYIEVTSAMIEMAPKPFVVYAVPPKSQFGVPIKDRYGLVHATSPEFWADEYRIRKFKELDKQFRNLTVIQKVVDGKEITAQYLYEIGGTHFENYWIAQEEVEGFVDYVRNLQVLIIQVFAANGDVVLSDVSIILRKENQLYGSFCQWNRDYKNRSPGIYACLLATRWAQQNHLQFYNLGPVDEYGYKGLFVTEYEPIFALVVSDPNHPIVLDPTSPINVDFEKEQINQIYRDPQKASQTGTALF